MKRNNLTVYVRVAYSILINDSKNSNPCACKCFYGVSADAANAKHRNVCLFYFQKIFYPKQQLCSFKLTHILYYMI